MVKHEMTMKMTSQSGLTLIEMMMVVAILSVLAAIAVPLYEGYIGEGRIHTAIQDIRQAELILNDLAMENDLGSLDAGSTAVRGVYLTDGVLTLGAPGTAPAGAVAWLDPWGNIYRYQRPATRTEAGGSVSNDSTSPQGYDLFSQGPDTGDATDDIMRGCNGEYLGSASGHPASC
jgi:prepilin-type N-terminal cleavage/methylation domain-containing protein